MSGTYTVYVVSSNFYVLCWCVAATLSVPGNVFSLCELCVCQHRVAYGCLLVLVLLAVSSLVSWWSVSSGNVGSVAGCTDAVYKDRHSCGRSLLFRILKC